MFAAFYRVDFSGARLAGLNTWIASIQAAKRNSKIPVFKLTYLERLGGICGADGRGSLRIKPKRPAPIRFIRVIPVLLNRALI